MTTDSVGGTTGSGSPGDLIHIMAITASASGALQSLGVNLAAPIDPDCLAKMALYGTFVDPVYSNLLCSTNSISAVAGWNDIPATGVNIVLGTTYYIAFKVYSATIDRAVYYNLDPNNIHYVAWGTYGDPFPDPTGNTTLINATYNVRMIYEEGPPFTGQVLTCLWKP